MNRSENSVIVEAIPHEILRHFALAVGKNLSLRQDDPAYYTPDVVNEFAGILKTVTDLIVKQKNEDNVQNLVSLDLLDSASVKVVFDEE